jgi:hypothetical protein
MPRIVGIFENGNVVDAVVEQLQLNGLTEVTVLGPEIEKHAVDQQLQVLLVPDRQADEYRTRLADNRWLLFVQASALDVPTVQRALRSSQAIDIDLLPESGA